MIQLTGELDSFVADQIGEPLRQFVDFAKGVVIDMAGVDFVDSQGLRLVEHLGELARASGGSLHLHDPSPVVTRLVGLLDGGARVDICHSAQAIAS
jgi:anti-anti-sigma factor